MKTIPNAIFDKIVSLTDRVQLDLKKKGLVIPIENKDGSITIGRYRIVNKNNFYNIVDKDGEVLVKNINLPQTAAVVANDLALGRFLNKQILDYDRDYGYAVFDEALHLKKAEKSKKRGIDHWDLMITKCNIARAKKQQYKNHIEYSFEKLVKIT